LGNDDRGQLLPLVALLVAMALGLAVLIVETALLVGERAAAQTAADAAALASVVEPGDGRGRASEMAVANGAVLESFRQLGASVEVIVRVGRASATARAVAAPCRGERCRPYAYP
jgi:Flp pilus assembly protein TadG